MMRSKRQPNTICRGPASTFKIHSWHDDAYHPRVLVSIIGENTSARYLVDLRKSLERESTNIGHSLLVCAVSRYAQAIEQGEKKEPGSETPRGLALPDAAVGQKCLQHLFTALREGAIARGRVRKTLDEADRDSYLDEAFRILAPILRQARAKKKTLTNHQRLQIVKQQFEESAEGLGGFMLYGKAIIEFLQHSRDYQNRGTFSLPKLKAEMLKNSFLAWLQNKEAPGTAGARRQITHKSSEARRKARTDRSEPAKQHLLYPWENYKPSDFAGPRHPLDGLVYEREDKS
jgi:hypothetical protein